MSQLQLVLTIIGHICVLTLFGWVCVRLKKKHPSKDYDERQKQAQGTAYQICFWAQILYAALVMSLSVDFSDANLTYSLPLLDVLLVGLFIQCMLFHICCLLQGAALPLSEHPRQAIGSNLFICIFDLFFYISSLKLESDGFPGPLKSWYYLLLAISSFYLALLHLIQFIRSKRAEQE